jgi:NADPH:quinone reductase-like Zn-dependent oxidoreductase
MLKGANLHGIFVGNRAMFEQMNAAIEVNHIKPVVGKLFAFDEAAAAYEYLRTQAHFGKVALTI